jgi:hypothetical protein
LPTNLALNQIFPWGTSQAKILSARSQKRIKKKYNQVNLIEVTFVEDLFLKLNKLIIKDTTKIVDPFLSVTEYFSGATQPGNMECKFENYTGKK